jgi:ribosome biogenesis protein Nip4
MSARLITAEAIAEASSERLMVDIVTDVGEYLRERLAEGRLS